MGGQQKKYNVLGSMKMLLVKNVEVNNLMKLKKTLKK